MNDDQFDDLKQFIEATVSQSETRIKDELGERIDGVEQRLGNLEKKVDDGFAGVADAIETINQRLDDHETECNERLTKLEQQAA
jgi:hypothetical protein